MIYGNFVWSSRIFLRVSPLFEKGSPRMKSMFIDILFSSLRGTKQFRVSCTWIATSLVTEIDAFVAMTDQIASSALSILSLSLLCITLRVSSFRLCTHIERRLIPRWRSHVTYSGVISSGLHSNDISVSPLFSKEESISATSSSVSTDGVPHPK